MKACNYFLDQDHGFKRITQHFKKNREVTRITIGIHEEEGAELRDSLNVAQIATIQEYGSKAANIPQRSFIRQTHDGHLQANIALLRQQELKVLDGKISWLKALMLLGEVAAKQIVSKINEGIPPPNAKSTIRRKKSSKPLIDTGQMKGSISYRIFSPLIGKQERVKVGDA